MYEPAARWLLDPGLRKLDYEKIFPGGLFIHRIF
jgi:hypothetical protein